VFVTTILFSPVFGKFINAIGSRNLFLYGTFLAGSTNILFGFLEYIQDPTTFFALSLAVRITSAIGESAFFCAIYPLATEVRKGL
jgi:MFS family permease